VQAEAEAQLAEAEAALATAQASGSEEIAAAQATAQAAEEEAIAAREAAEAAEEAVKAAAEEAMEAEEEIVEVSLPIDKITVGTNGNIISVDTTVAHQVASFQATVLTSGRLFKWNNRREVVPELVESWEWSDDGLILTTVLHEGLQFSDGSPLTSEDVVYTWERIQDAPPVNLSLALTVESVEATNDRTIVWTHSAPNPDFLHWFGYEYMTIHPKALIESDPEYWDHPVSSGPYFLKEWVPNSPTALLEANPYYVGGEMAIKQIEMVFVPDMTSRVLQLATGAIDYVQDLPANAKESLPPEVRTKPNPISGVNFIAINMAATDSPLNNRDVRYAISLAIDREEIAEKAFFGITRPVAAIMYPGGDPPLVEEYHEVLPNGGARDLEAARELLASTPYADGFDMTLQTWGFRPGWLDATLIIKENLAELGINVEIESLEDSVAVNNLITGNFVAQWTGGGGFPPIVAYGNQFTALYSDWCSYQNEEIVDLLTQATSEIDPEERISLLNQIEELYYEDLPYIPIVERVELSGSRLPGEFYGMAPFGQYPFVMTLEEAQAELNK
jgi:peptide/nickel transport system substrate-binding protein